MPGSRGRRFRPANYLITTAARAPSVHNSQPWRFRVGEHAIEFSGDPGRKLRVDPAGPARADGGLTFGPRAW